VKYVIERKRGVYDDRNKSSAYKDLVWKQWLGGNPQDWPQRACIGVNLEGDVLIEVSVTAIRAVTLN